MGQDKDHKEDAATPHREVFEECQHCGKQYADVHSPRTTQRPIICLTKKKMVDSPQIVYSKSLKSNSTSKDFLMKYASLLRFLRLGGFRFVATMSPASLIVVPFS